MWINRDVNLPERLITAQRDGKLVVFAGAGVSMGPPSNLPSFEKLADLVAAGAYTRLPREALDKFFGRIERDVDVQRRTRDIIGVATSLPTELHRDLADLFGNAQGIRIVTTNFDRHFSSVVSERFGSAIDHYYAPALPLGRDFSGLVYLHGSITKAEPLVLTDRDFGRAYITDAWATRFLTELFTTFSVLFIGYSHQDPVMHYLARGFVGASQRFAMTPPGQDDHWIPLGITPVEFPLRAAPAEKYGGVRDSIRAWADRGAMGVLEHEARIEQIVKSPPPLEPDVADYIASVLRDPVALRFFAKHARSTDWLQWATDKGALDNLFVPMSTLTQEEQILGQWFARNFAVESPKEALELVQKHGLRLGPFLWQTVAWEVAHRKPPLDAESLTRWGVVLESSRCPDWDPQPLLALMATCTSDELSVIGLLLFKSLAIPRLQVDRIWSHSSSDDEHFRFAVKLGIAGDGSELLSIWRTFFLLRLSSNFDQFAVWITETIVAAYSRLRAAGRLTDDWDPLSYGRSAIEPHGQDPYPESWEMLIDVARDLIEWGIANEPDKVASIRDQWKNSNLHLLRRIAIHGLTEDPRVTPDQALLLVEREDLLYATYLKHEIFRLLQRAFPRASVEAQERFIAYSLTTRGDLPGEGADEEALRSAAYQRFNVSVWLAKVAPSSVAAKTHFERMQLKHEDFAPREYPDLDHWSSGVHSVTPKSPESAEDLIASDPCKRTDWLLTYSPESRWDDAPDRVGLLQEIQKAAATSPEWGLRLADCLRLEGKFDTDIWSSLFSGWKDAELNPDQWSSVITLVEAAPSIGRVADRSIVDLLEHGVDKTGLPTPLYSRAEAIGELLIRSTEKESSVETPGRQEWLTKAINQVGGRVAMFWLKMLSKNSAAAGDRWVGVSPEDRKRFETFLQGDGANAQSVRIVFASQLHFLYSVDREWAREALLPFFDWDKNALRAQQAWHGFLGWGQWNDALFAELRPFVIQTFSGLRQKLEDAADTLCERLADVAVYTLTNPYVDGWLGSFIGAADLESRQLWAEKVEHTLNHLAPEAADRLWSSWVRPYWEARVTGIPRQLTDDEKKAMLGWSLAFPEHFGGAVDLVERMGIPSEVNGFLFYRLDESRLAVTKPSETARFLRIVLRALHNISFACDRVFNIGRTLANSVNNLVDVRVIAEEMARLGCESGKTLKQLADERDPK